MECIYSTEEFYATTRQTWKMIDRVNELKEIINNDPYMDPLLLEPLMDQVRAAKKLWQDWLDSNNRQRAMFKAMFGYEAVMTEDEDNWRTMINKIIKTIDEMEE